MIAKFKVSGGAGCPPCQVEIEDNLNTTITFGSTSRTFPTPREAYDNYRPFAHQDHSYWSICYHLDDYLEEKAR